MKRSLPFGVVVIGHLALLAWLWQGSPGQAGGTPAWVQAPVAASVLMVRVPVSVEAAPTAVAAPMRRERAAIRVAAEVPREPTAIDAPAAPSQAAAASESIGNAPASAAAAISTSPATPAETAAAPPPPRIEAPMTHAHADHAACPQAPYPPVLRERGIEGVVRLLVLVDAQGQPAQVRLVVASGWRLFDDAAVAQVRGRCRFVPARRGGEAIESWVDFPVRFALNG